MFVAILVLIFAFAIFWLVFFKFKFLRLTPGWGFVFAFFVIHLLLVFIIGLKFVTPNSANATVVQHTIQLIPRLPEPTLVTALHSRLCRCCFCVMREPPAEPHIPWHRRTRESEFGADRDEERNKLIHRAIFEASFIDHTFANRVKQGHA